MANKLNLSVTLKAINKATGPLRQIMQGSQGVGRAMRETRDELKGLQDQQKKITAFRDMSRKSHATRRALMDQREELKRITQEIQSTTGPTKRLAQQQRRAESEAAKLSKQYREQRNSVKDLARELPEGTRGTRGLKDQNAALEEQIRRTNNRLEAQRNALSRLADANVAGRFNKMTGEVRRFGRNVMVAGGAAAGSIFTLANSTAGLGDDVGKTAAKLGLTKAELQEFRYAGERSGVATKTLDSSMVAFTKRLGEAAGGSGAAVKGYEALGLSAERLSEMPVAAAMAEVADKMKDIENPTRRNAIAAQLYSRAGVGLVNMLKDGSAGLKGYAADARRTGYVLGDKAVKDSEAFKDTLLDTQLSFFGLKNIIGAELMPVVGELMGKLTGWLAENRDQVKQFAKAFGQSLKDAIPIIQDVASGVSRLATGIGNVVSKAASLVGGYENLAMVVGGLFASKMIASVISFGVGIVKAAGALGAFAKTLPLVSGAVKALGVAFAATPIGWLIAGIAAVAGAAYLIYKNWDSIAAFFQNRWTDVKAAFDGGISGVTRLLLNWNPIGLIYRGITAGLGALGIEVPEKFSTLGGLIVDGLFGGMKAILSTGWAEVKAAFDGGLAGISALLVNWSPLGLLWRGISTALSQLGVDLPAKFSEMGGHIISGIASGITSRLSSVGETIRALGESIKNWFKEVLGIASPSKVFAGFGGDIVQGIINGVSGMVGALRDQVMGLAGDIANWMKDAIGSAWDSGKDIAAGIGAGIRDGANATGRAIKDGAGTAWEAGKSTAANVGRGIKDGASDTWTAIKEFTVGTENEAREGFDTNSPSRVFAAIGGDVMAGMTMGIKRSESGPLKQIGDFAKRATRAGAGVALAAGIASPALAASSGVSATGSAINFDTRPPLQHNAGAAGAVNINLGGITVNAAPGMDEQALAQLVNQQVQRALATAQRTAEARARRNLHDNE